MCVEIVAHFLLPFLCLFLDLEDLYAGSFALQNLVQEGEKFEVYNKAAEKKQQYHAQ